MRHAEFLSRVARHASDYLDGLDRRPVSATAGADELRRRLARALPERPRDAALVIDELVRDVDGGILASSGARFFGWVIGGTLPAALAADWLTATWDQNAASFACSPAEAVVEEVAGGWLKELLGLPNDASFAFVTGCQMAHATALAAARHRLLAARGIDVECCGLSGAPPLRVLAGENRHESILRAVRLLGIGSDALEELPCEETGGIRLDALAAALAREPARPTILSLIAGDLNTGAFDCFPRAIALARAAGAWVHVDGAFGLWARVSERYRHLLEGVESADSWATDGHKWLNLPFDNGFVFVADPAAHSAAFAQATSYVVRADGAREQKDWNPEWSRRGRGFAAYAAIRSLGREGIAEIVERTCAFTAALVDALAALPGVEVLARPVINQALVRFLAKDGDHDAETDRVIARIQASGSAWFGGTSWRGKRAMRISVCSWRTSEAELAPVVAAVSECLANRSNA